MHVPFPCPKSFSELKSTDKGFYCSDCKHHLVDMRNPKQPSPVKGSCVITEVPQEKYEALNRTYRFALALFIVMGSSIIVNNNVEANSIVKKLESIKEKYTAVDSSKIELNGVVSDSKGRAVKPVKITIMLSDGSVIENVVFQYGRMVKNYSVTIPKEQINQTITIRYEYFKKVKTETVILNDYYFEVPDVEFKRNRKDKYSKKRYPVHRFVGKF